MCFLPYKSHTILETLPILMKLCEHTGRAGPRLAYHTNAMPPMSLSDPRLACPLLQLLCTIERLDAAKGVAADADADAAAAAAQQTCPLHLALAELLSERSQMYTELQSSSNIFQAILLDCHAFVTTATAAAEGSGPAGFVAPSAETTLARLKDAAQDGSVWAPQIQRSRLLYFQNGVQAKSGFEMCFGPSALGAGASVSASMKSLMQYPVKSREISGGKGAKGY